MSSFGNIEIATPSVLVKYNTPVYAI